MNWADNKMAAVKHRRNSEKHRVSQPRETAKQFGVTDSSCDVVGLYKSGRRRSARLRGKVAVHGGNEGFTSVRKRNWAGNKSQRQFVTEGPAKKIAKVTKQLSQGQNRSMDDVAAGQTVATKLLKVLGSADSATHHKGNEEESVDATGNSCLQRSPEGPAQDKQKVVKSPYFNKKHCQMSKLAFKVKRHRHLLYPHFKPAPSPIGLVQEQLYDNPWKLLVATIFLNRTTGVLALPVLWKFFEQFPDPNAVLTGNPLDIANLMQPLGLNNKRAGIIHRLSKEYLTKDWVYPEELHGIGKYGNDSYRIFCCGAEWMEVTPTDHKLNEYYEWLTKQHADGALVMNSSWYPTVDEGMS